MRKKDYNRQMGVSKNKGTPKWMVNKWKSLLRWMIWGYHYFRKHPNHGTRFETAKTTTTKMDDNDDNTFHLRRQEDAELTANQRLRRFLQAQVRGGVQQRCGSKSFGLHPSRELTYSRWWFQIFVFSPLFGEDFQFDEYFSIGLKPPTSIPLGKVAGKMIFLHKWDMRYETS